MIRVVDKLLSIQDLSVGFGLDDEFGTVVEQASFDIYHGQKLALVGESGSGKSVTALSILRLHDPVFTRYQSGKIIYQNQDLLKLPLPQIEQIRGRDIAMIFQEPMTAMNPLYTIGNQLAESLLLHEKLNRAAVKVKVIDLLDKVGIQEPQKRVDAYPHMLSGGQRQRVMIAMALACNPRLLIADEPTTALDVTIQKQILELLDSLQAEFNMSVLLISHDLNLVHHFADYVCVMEQGHIVEQGDTKRVFSDPQHAYTQKLLASEPEPLFDQSEAAALKKKPAVLTGKKINCHFPVKAGFFRRTVDEIRAVNDVDLELYPAETVGIVGESGSGKTTLGMSLLRLYHAEGDIEFDGNRIDQLAERDVRPFRRQMQMVFQDPFSSLSPRMNIEQIISEGLKLHFPELSREQRLQRVIDVLNEVDMDGDMIHRYPHEFSGGQRQRIAVARAIVLEPKLILLDEPTSALDISVQKQVLQLLRDLQIKHRMSYLFISHDLKVVRSIAHRVMVMKDGYVVEQGSAEAVFDHPQHQYTQRLLQASLFK